MQYEFLLWVAVFVHSIHLLEEIYLNARDYQVSVGVPKAGEGEFYFAYATFLLSGVAMAMIGWKAPAFGLMYPLYLMLNVLLFHVITAVKTRRFSPGLLSGVALIFPVGIACFWGAAQDGVLTWRVAILSLLLAMIYSLVPFILFRAKAILDGKQGL